MSRHHLPDEFDLLVDTESGFESGFGVAPLRAHVRECAACRAELTRAETVAEALDVLPYFAPSIGFADRVMADVQVFEPWHVALADTARRLVPASAPMRVLAASGALTTGALLTTIVLWVLARADVLAFTTDAAAAYARGALWDGLRGTIIALAGTSATSGATVALALAMLVAALIIAGTGLRTAAAASRRVTDPDTV